MEQNESRGKIRDEDRRDRIILDEKLRKESK